MKKIALNCRLRHICYVSQPRSELHDHLGVVHCFLGPDGITHHIPWRIRRSIRENMQNFDGQSVLIPTATYEAMYNTATVRQN